MLLVFYWAWKGVWVGNWLECKLIVLFVIKCTISKTYLGFNVFQEFKGKYF